jgi:error-prone DNA polymerase
VTTTFYYEFFYYEFFTMSFIHLRTTSAYSFKYGTTQPRDLVERAAEFEMPALALTDRDSFAGTIRFAKSCLDYGIAPLI